MQREQQRGRVYVGEEGSGQGQGKKHQGASPGSAPGSPRGLPILNIKAVA